jgi:DNA-binding MarR family transcriptional regulator
MATPRGNLSRGMEAIYRAHKDYGYYPKEIADYLGVHYATVNRALDRATQAG